LRLSAHSRISRGVTQERAGGQVSATGSVTDPHLAGPIHHKRHHRSLSDDEGTARLSGDGHLAVRCGSTLISATAHGLPDRRSYSGARHSPEGLPPGLVVSRAQIPLGRESRSLRSFSISWVAASRTGLETVRGGWGSRCRMTYVSPSSLSDQVTVGRLGALPGMLTLPGMSLTFRDQSPCDDLQHHALLSSLHHFLQRLKGLKEYQVVGLGPVEPEPLDGFPPTGTSISGMRGGLAGFLLLRCEDAVHPQACPRHIRGDQRGGDGGDPSEPRRGKESPEREAYQLPIDVQRAASRGYGASSPGIGLSSVSLVAAMFLSLISSPLSIRQSRRPSARRSV
jgi:hypothetical protein